MSVAAEVVARARAAADDETSRRIIAAAVERFTAFGIRRTTMDDVAASAGIGRATLYRRYAGRDEIVRAAVLQEMAGFITTVEEAVADLTDPGDRLVEGFVAILRAARTHPLLHRLLETESTFILPFLTTDGGAVLGLCRDYLAEQLRGAQHAGIMRTEIDPEVSAEVLVRLCQSLLLTPRGVIDADDEEGLRRLARAYVVPVLFGADVLPAR